MNTRNGFVTILFPMMIAGLASAAAQSEKFRFDGAAAGHPVTMELESVAYRPKGMDLYFKVVNHSATAVDFSRANWKVNYGNQSAYIAESEFDGFIVQPNSKRFAHISFATDENLKSGFNNERANGTSQIEIDNIVTFNNKKVPKISLKNF